MHNTADRRNFLKASAATIAASCGVAAAEDDRVAKSGPLVGAFTESFQDYSIPKVCRLFQQMGLDGLDLTVRPGGHIQPGDAPKALPAAAKAAREAKTRLLFLTTAITDANKDAEELLAVTADCGVDRIKMGYYRYTEFGSLRRQMDDVRRRIDGVSRLAARYGVKPCVHIHSGPLIPSHGTMLYELLRDLSPDDVGAYVDPMHMTMEGGGDGWRQGLDLLAPWIALCSVKNFVYEKTERDSHGQQRWRRYKVPVADGIAALPDFVDTLKRLEFDGYYSLHSEYKGGSWRNLTTQECLEQTKVDLRYFRKLL